MNVTLEKNGNVEAKIIVNVVADDYTEKVKKELRQFAATHVIPGFRKGHVPMNEMRRRFGRQVKSDVINDLVYNEVVKYIRENNLSVLGEPMPVELKEMTLEDGDYTFEYEIGLTPDFNVVCDKTVKIPYYTIEVTDAMREDQDKYMRERLGAQVPGEEVEDKALVKGVLMELNEDGTVKETEDAIQVVNGIVAPSFFFNKEEATKFEGKKVNDKVVFNPWNSCNGNAAELSSMLNVDKDKAVNVKSDFELAISEIIVLRPAEHNQDFFDNVFGKDKVHNEEEYKEALTQMIAANLVGNSKQLFARDARDYFVEKYGNAELPVEFLKKWLVARNEELTAENIDEEFDKMRPALIWQLVSGEIARQLNVQVTEEAMLDYAKHMARDQFAQYGITNLDDETITEHARRILADKNYRQRIAENVSEAVLYAAIENAVNLETKTVSLDEFKALAEKQ